MSKEPGFLDRRRFLATTLAGAGAAVLGLSGCAPRQLQSTPGPVALPVPPLANSRLVDGVRRFDLTVQSGTSQLVGGHPELSAATFGYNGPILGPTLRAAAGERIAVQVHNTLHEDTTVHWHGMHLPASMDGGPHTPIGAGQRAQVHWQLRQPAATLWYHPHPHGRTESQVLKGLAGLFLIDDSAAMDSGLPSRYGEDDVPLILQDKYLAEDGGIVVRPGDNGAGTVGTTLLANGVAGARFEVGSRLVRLRLLNGCSARILDLRFSDARSFRLVGTDGGLLPDPVELTHLLLSPAERAEILVRFTPGDQVGLETSEPRIEGIAREASLQAMTPGRFVEFTAKSTMRPAARWTLPAGSRALLNERDAAVHRVFELRLPRINGRSMDVTRVDAVAKLGDTEIWEVFTHDLVPHNFHVHDVQFRILDIDGYAPPAVLSGWKDTVLLLPSRRYRLIMRFEHYADAAIPYMMHCHLLQHEDAGMMAQFLVTEDGTGPSLLPAPAGTVHRH